MLFVGFSVCLVDILLLNSECLVNTISAMREKRNHLFWVAPEIIKEKIFT
jgi:hypothetical protein